MGGKWAVKFDCFEMSENPNRRCSTLILRFVIRLTVFSVFVILKHLPKQRTRKIKWDNKIHTVYLLTHFSPIQMKTMHWMRWKRQLNSASKMSDNVR